MVENLLTKAIRSYLATKLKDFLLPCEDPEKGKSLQIINGYLPPKTTKEKVSDEDLYPFVLVRPESAETDRESTVVTVAIIIGTYSKESIGHEYALNVMTRIREALCTLPDLQLEGKYQIEFPIKWEATTRRHGRSGKSICKPSGLFEVPNPHFPMEIFMTSKKKTVVESTQPKVIYIGALIKRA